MAPDMTISMRGSKLKAEEAALLMGEVKKPSWQSRNEGIHERVSFEDAIWGFDLAGGLFYKTPLRVTYVKPESRADKAGIRAGDKLLRINDIDTSTLTIQEAHKLIVESGIHLKLAVTAPDDEEDAYFCYQDPVDAGYDSEEERRLEEEKAKKRQVHAKVSSYWSLQWPWVSKRRVIYRESNCFMVPSKYEGKHKEQFPELPVLRTEDDIVLFSKDKNPHQKSLQEDIDKKTPNGNSENLTNIENSQNDTDCEKKNISKKHMKNEEDIQQNGILDEIPEEEESIQEDITKSQIDVSAGEASSSRTENLISNEEEILNEVIVHRDISKEEEEDHILDGILNDSNSDSSHER